MFYPMFALAILSIGVATYLFSLRVFMSKSGRVDPRLFKLNKSKEMPDILVQTSNNFSNLFEIPVLFYAACLTAIATSQQTITLQALAWLFVLSRIIHTYIHLTKNKIIPRLFAFISGVILVLIMWLVLFFQQIGFFS